MKRDQKFFDVYSLVIGVLAFVALGIFVLAMKMSELTQDVYTSSTEEYQAAVTRRLQPFGQVYMPGEDIPADEPQVAEAAPAKPVATTLTGPQVFNEACIACHGSGVGGAPMLSDTDNWAPRIEQGMDVLRQHALNGYAGSAGYMPPKGGRVDLSDQEIFDAIEYMVSEAQQGGG
ncbi:MAG TPA: c-type cytochrome [Woeseiaceae bacterium]|nr:c-type cytochrome [Woeseiaceae bacterium]